MKEKVLDILARACEDDIVKEDLNIELFESDLLDSLGFIQLVVDLEEEFGITIAPSELDRSQINTPQMIIDLVSERMAG